ncbi:MAG: hypothetical protein H0U22_13600 [Geodermatophilaceae bacterium]|nr:hypothetical protein [Geodermatophilaceae bacterium]
MTSHPPDHNRPFQPPQSPPGQAPYTPSQAFQPPPGQPGQPPYPGQPLQGPPQPYGQPAQPVQPYGQPAELPAQPQGPPANATAGRSALWPVALVVLSLVVVAASYWMGTYLGVYGNRGISFYLLIALVAVTVAALVAVWSETAFEVRTWGSDLFGKTALGWRRIDLANLTSAAIAAGRGSKYIVLGDSQGRIMFSDKKLGPVIDSVRRGLFEAAQKGRFAVPTDLAKLLGLPVQQGARRLGKSGNLTRVFTVLGLIAIGLILGVVLVS